jgi:hypothetical protein
VLTAAITAAVAGILAIFGVKPTVAQLAVVAVVVKVIIVLTGVFFGSKLIKRRQAAAVAREKPPEPESR